MCRRSPYHAEILQQPASAEGCTGRCIIDTEESKESVGYDCAAVKEGKALNSLNGCLGFHLWNFTLYKLYTSSISWMSIGYIYIYILLTLAGKIKLDNISIIEL